MMEEKKNPRSWGTWIITITMVIQMLTAFEYYNRYRELHDLALLQRTALQLQIESLEAVNQSLESLHEGSS